MYPLKEVDMVYFKLEITGIFALKQEYPNFVDLHQLLFERSNLTKFNAKVLRIRW